MTSRALRIGAATLVVLAVTAAAPGRTQRARGSVSSDSTDRFVAQARAATLRYRDRARAVADGYVVKGPDFPGMGEHWFNVRIIFARTFDAAHPAILEYATIAGHPTLVGVAYALPLLPGETPPAFPSVDAWHSHLGTVDEEAQLPSQAHEHADGGAMTRLVMLHAWIWLENPAGEWESDNWALPFAEAGLRAPAHISPSAGRAMSLVSHGDSYFSALLEAQVAATAGDSAVIRAAIADARARVGAIAAAGARRDLGDADTQALESAWHAMWAGLEAHLSAAARDRLAPIAKDYQGGTHRHRPE